MPDGGIVKDLRHSFGYLVRNNPNRRIPKKTFGLEIPEAPDMKMACIWNPDARDPHVDLVGAKGAKKGDVAPLALPMDCTPYRESLHWRNRAETNTVRYMKLNTYACLPKVPKPPM